jgi:hypothetical protein
MVLDFGQLSLMFTMDYNPFVNYLGSPDAEEWGVWCGGEAATPHPPIPSDAE